MSTKGFDHMRQSFNKALEDTLSFVGGGSFGLPIDIVETADSLIILTAPLLGVVPDKLDISFHNNALTIVGETAPDEDIPEHAYLRRERRYGRFSRKVNLPRAVDADKAKAELKDGILKITLPKRQEQQAKTINVTRHDTV